MSVSPQSLARTRDKRSHKVPARFNDNVYALVEASETVRTSTRTRPGSLASKREHEEEGGEEKEETVKVMKTQNASVKKSKTGSHNESVSTTSKPLSEHHVDRNSPSTPPPSKTPSPTIPPLATTTTTTATTSATTAPTTTTTTTTITTTNTQPKTSTTQKQPTSVGTASSTSNSSSNSSNPVKKEVSTPPLTSSKKKKSNKGQSLIAKQQAAATTATSSSKQVNNYKSAAQRQGPTATISGGLSNFNIHQSSQPIQPPVNGATPIIVANGTAQPAPSMPAPAPTVAPITIPAAGPMPTTPRYFNNLTTNQQFGTRLMINEPIYLPKSVAPIAPITATLHQIALQARRPPFISKKAEACLAYQEELRLNYMLSNHAALIKIARYLGFRDRLNLRCVNKTWKSIVDSEAVWKRVIFEENDFEIDPKPWINKYLSMFKTTEVVIKELGNNTTKLGLWEEYFIDLPLHVQSIKHVLIRSVNYDQNNIAYRILQDMRVSCLEVQSTERPHMRRCKWQVRIAVDPTGIATVDMDISLLSDWGKQVPSRSERCIELFDLVENLCEVKSKHKIVEIEVEPI